MESQEGGGGGGGDGAGAVPTELQDLTREALYGLVWAEPMLRVSARFKVSSSYMARICSLMNVPRPERGYWAKLAVGKAPKQPPLPEIRPGDQAIWNRTGSASPVSRPIPKPPVNKPKRKPTLAATIPAVHPLIHGAKEHFEAGRTSYWSKYLRPAKRNLVDLIVSKTGLEKALAFANLLFREFEAHECRVVLAPNGERVHRAVIDEHEVPKKKANDPYDHSRHWSPGRLTIVYVGSIAIGLTIIELSEEAEGTYVDGDYVRTDQLPVPKRGRRIEDWRISKHEFPSGRLCLQAYCPDWRSKWTQQWREAKGHDLATKVPAIIRELIDATPHIAELIAEGQREADIERARWEEQSRKWERERAEEAVRKARKESKDELLAIIEEWIKVRRIEEFFEGIEAGLGSMGAEERQGIQDRLVLAKASVGAADAMRRFRTWKTPRERLGNSALPIDEGDQ